MISVFWTAREGLYDRRIFAVEAFVVPRPEVRYAVRFDAQRPVAVEFQLVSPAGSFWQSVRADEQHRLDEFRFGLLARHSGLHDGKS